MKVKDTNEGQNPKSNVSCPLYNIKTFKNFFMKLCTNTKNYQMMCREKE